MRDVVTIHYLLPAADGPIPTGPHGIDDPHGMLDVLGIKIPERRLRFACHPTAVQSHLHRGSNDVQKAAGDRHIVNCEACQNSPEFKAAYAELMAQHDPKVMFDARGKIIR